MLRRVRMLSWVAAMIVAVFVAGTASASDSPLVKLAASRFPNLTHAERALLEHADVKNVGRADYAVAGPSAKLDDPSNNPANAANWDAQREIRASLIRWMSVDPDAIRQIDPQGIRVLGAKIIGGLNLSLVHVPFAITLRNCAIPEAMELADAEIPSLGLPGSYSGPIHGDFSTVSGRLNLGDGYHANGIVSLQEAAIGSLYAGDGHFQYVAEPGYYLTSYKSALNLLYARISGSVWLANGFESNGGVAVSYAKIGGDFACDSGHFLNPGNFALDAPGADIGGAVWLDSAESFQNTVAHGGYFIADGLVRFDAAHVGSFFMVNQAKFNGKPGEPHGLHAPGLIVHGPLLWRDAVLENGAQLDLSGASVTSIVDQQSSWPAPGNLLIDGLTYSGFATPDTRDAPGDADTRLRWIALQPTYHPQPYRQLAKVLREAGDDSGAVKVLIAAGDAQYGQHGFFGRMLGWLLKVTIGYGHRPFRTILWMAGVMLLGWLLVSTGARAGVMRATWPDSPPPSEAATYEKLHPMLYSLDVFLPFVNLHQEHYWWPDAERSGECSILGARFRISGAFLRYYLWAQVIAGWLLSAIFVAGVTGLMRND
jgi:hypothetical protein